MAQSLPKLQFQIPHRSILRQSLHYVFDLWVKQWRQKSAHGDMIVVRYTDDAVLSFEHKADAEVFLEQLRERMRNFGLELHAEKTRLIEFGRFAKSKLARDFLHRSGLHHIFIRYRSNQRTISPI